MSGTRGRNMTYNYTTHDNSHDGPWSVMISKEGTTYIGDHLRLAAAAVHTAQYALQKAGEESDLEELLALVGLLAMQSAAMIRELDTKGEEAN